jgi:hypothetical protein
MTLASESRDVRNFNAVTVSGMGDLRVEQNSDPAQPEMLLIEADQAALPHIRSEVRGERLVLRLEWEWWNPARWIDWLFMDKTVRYTVRLNRVRGLAISGAGSVSGSSLKTERCELSVSGSGRFVLDDLQATELESRISGSGDISLSGAAGPHSIRISGSGRVRALDLETQTTQVRISGSGRAEVQAKETLEVSISGSGDVRYLGSPQVTQHISGAGRVRQIRSGS